MIIIKLFLDFRKKIEVGMLALTHSWIIWLNFAQLQTEAPEEKGFSFPSQGFSIAFLH